MAIAQFGPRRAWSVLFTAGLIAMAWSSLPCLAAAETERGRPAAETGKVLSRTYFFKEANREMPYSLYVSTHYQPEHPAPLVILLHGWGSNPAGVIQYAGIVQEAEKRGYVVAAPMGYNEVGWYGNPGPGAAAQAEVPVPGGAPQNRGVLSEHDVLNVLELVRGEFHTDARRTYLMGHSMGGGGTLYLGMKFPKTWAALAALSPAIYSSPEEVKALRRVPVMVVQGELDRLVQTQVTRRWVAAMEEFGVPHEYLEIKGGDHIFSIAANPKMIGRVFAFFDAHRQ